MSQSQAARQRLDDLRHFASELGTATGLAPARAASLASHLLWFDAAGLPRFGIATLPDWLARIEGGEVDPKAEGKVGTEHAATAVFDGQRGVGPLILARAAEIASEKAREVGVGLIRVRNLGPVGSAAAVVAEAAIGPMVAAALGPGPSWAVAVPSAGGLPAVADSALAAKGTPPVPPWPMLAPEGEWIIQVASVAALEPLTTLQDRVSAGLDAWAADSDGLLRPDRWEARRREAREHGVAVDPKAWKELRRRAEQLGVRAPASSPGR